MFIDFHRFPGLAWLAGLLGWLDMLGWLGWFGLAWLAWLARASGAKRLRFHGVFMYFPPKTRRSLIVFFFKKHVCFEKWPSKTYVFLCFGGKCMKTQWKRSLFAPDPLASQASQAKPAKSAKQIKPAKQASQPSLEIYGNLWTSMNIYGNWWTSMKIYEHL